MTTTFRSSHDSYVRRIAAAPLYDYVRANRTADLAEILGVNREQISRWRKSGISVYDADRLAGALGAHPFDIWGDEWWGDE